MCACGGSKKRRITQQEQRPAQSIGSTNQQAANYANALEAQKVHNQASNPKKIYR